MLLKPILGSVLEIFSCLYAAERTDFDSTLPCVVFWLPSLFQMQPGLCVASCLVQWWISNCTSARFGSDCSCNQSVQQRWYRGVWHRATVPWMQAENLLQSQHIPGRTIHPTSPSSSDPPGGAVRVHLITCDPSVCCNLCLQTQSPSVEFIARLPQASQLVYTPKKHVAYWTFFFLFPIPPPFSLSLFLLHWEQIKPRSSSPDSLQFISLLFLC